MKITDIKTKETCKNCGVNLLNGTLKTSTNVGIFCNNCSDIAMLMQSNYRKREEMVNFTKSMPGNWNYFSI